MSIPEEVQDIRCARVALKIWVLRLKAMVEGLPVEKHLIPIQFKKCLFGQWLYGSGAMLAGFSVFDEIKPVHRAMHETGEEIISLMTAEPKGLASMLHHKDFVKNNQLKAQKMLPKLLLAYEQTLHLLAILEQDCLNRALKEQEGSTHNNLLLGQTFGDVMQMLDALDQDVDSWLKKGS